MTFREEAQQACDNLTKRVLEVLRDKAETDRRLIIALGVLRALARLENEMAAPVRDLARATLLDLGETW